MACIGAATSCQGLSLLICWDSGAREEITTSSLGIGDVATTDAISSFYAPGGSLCAIEDVSTANGIRQASLSNANGMLIGSLAYVASSGYVWTCGGKQYLENAVGSPACAGDPMARLALGQGCSALDAPSCP